MGQDRIPQRSQRSGSPGPNDRDRGSGDIWRFVGCLLVVLVGSWPAPALFCCYVCRGRLLVARVARYRGGATFWLRSERTEAPLVTSAASTSPRPSGRTRRWIPDILLRDVLR